MDDILDCCDISVPRWPRLNLHLVQHSAIDQRVSRRRTNPVMDETVAIFQRPELFRMLRVRLISDPVSMSPVENDVRFKQAFVAWEVEAER